MKAEWLLPGAIVLSVAFVSGSGAQTKRQDAVTTACIAAAFKQYNAANVAILQSAAPILTIEASIAQRRLQERYCLEFARCVVSSIPPQSAAIPAAAAFSSCLKDEAYSADPSD